MPRVSRLPSGLHIPLGLMIVVLLGLLYITYINFSKLSKATELDTHSYEVLKKNQDVLTSLVNMQTGARGFYLAGMDTFLEPYLVGQKEFTQHFTDLEKLTASNAMQQAQLQKLLSHKLTWQGMAEDYIGMRRDVNNNKIALEQLTGIIQTGRGKKIFDDMRTTLAEIKAEETVLLNQRATEVNKLQTITQTLLRTGGLFAATLTIILFILFSKNMQRLAATNIRLEKEITERQQAEVNMRQSKSRVRAILANVAEGIVTINEQGLIESYNPEAARIFGYTPEEALGQNITLLMPTHMHGAHTAGFAHYLNTGVARLIGKSAVEVPGQRKDGSIFPLELKLSEVHMDEQRLFIGIMSDITERKQTQEKLRKNEERYRFLYEDNPLMYLTVDTKGHILSINKYGASYLGYSVEELLGKNRIQLIHEQDREFSLMSFLACVRDETELSQWELRRVRKDGSSFWAKETIRLARDASGDMLGLIVCEDITELKQVERMKNEFISTVSHELRTPMTSILGSLGLIKGGVAGEISAQAKTLIGIAHSNSERLVRLINDILDVEKIESGKMSFTTVPMNLMRLLEQAIEANQAYGDLYGVKFLLQEVIADATVNSDHDRLMQVMANLLSNAVKFSPHGDTVVIAMTRQENAIRVAVSDHGPGIPDNFRNRIFEKFAQADSSDTRVTQGTGLGLSISRAIIEKLGGNIGFETETGVGTTFYFDLPELEAQPNLITASPGEIESPRILICEDDVDIAKLLSMMLMQDGYQTDIAYNAAQTKQLLTQHSYAAMTLDIMLPDQDGISLIRELRKQPNSANLPIVVISAKADAGRVELNGDAVGIIDWLDKPIDQSRLMRSVKQAARHSLNSKPRILHVEDDADIAQVVALLLQGCATVVRAADLQQARQLLKQQIFSLVILDVGLPDGNGLDLLPLLSIQSPPIPVVVFSGHELDAETASSLDATLIKSTITNEKLLDTIQSLMQLDNIAIKMEST
ncbi:MAG: PAS domain S-box protein [Gammaproteobacteria bacterium]